MPKKSYFLPHKGTWLPPTSRTVYIAGWMCATLPTSYAISCYIRTRPVKRK